MAGDLARIGDEVGVREHDSLRHALGAGGEEDHGGIVRPAPGARRDPPREKALGEPGELVEARHRGAQILDEDDPPTVGESRNDVVELALLDEAAGRDDGLDAGKIAGGAQVPDPGGEVQHPRHAAACVEGEEDDGKALHVRQEHADRLAGRGDRRELAPEDERAEDEAAIGQRVALRILERRAVPPEAVAGVEQRAEEGRSGLRDIEREAHAAAPATSPARPYGITAPRQRRAPGPKCRQQ